jgi:hypothetical protein
VPDTFKAVDDDSLFMPKLPQHETSELNHRNESHFGVEDAGQQWENSTADNQAASHTYRLF